MKIKKEFISHNLDGSEIMVSASGSFSGYLKSNKTASFITSLLREEITREEIINKLLEKYDAPAEVISKDVDRILDTLRKVGALDE